jgi:hypothetical protein
MVAAMDAAGVDGALLVSPYSLYRHDASYALEVGAAHPGRFGLIKPVDPKDRAVGETIADWAKTQGTVGTRLLPYFEASEDPADPGMNRALAAAARYSLPVNLLCWGRLDQAKGLIARNFSATIVVDHLGLPQPFEPPVPAQPWAEFDAGRTEVLVGYDDAAGRGPCRIPASRAHFGGRIENPLVAGIRDERGTANPLSELSGSAAERLAASHPEAGTAAHRVRGANSRRKSRRGTVCPRNRQVTDRSTGGRTLCQTPTPSSRLAAS